MLGFQLGRQGRAAFFQKNAVDDAFFLIYRARRPTGLPDRAGPGFRQTPADFAGRPGSSIPHNRRHLPALDRSASTSASRQAWPARFSSFSSVTYWSSASSAGLPLPSQAWVKARLTSPPGHSGAAFVSLSKAPATWLSLPALRLARRLPRPRAFRSLPTRAAGARYLYSFLAAANQVGVFRSENSIEVPAASSAAPGS